LSKYLHQLKWLDKKILDGYFGFNIVKLNELYNEDVLKNIKYFFDKESFEIDDISDTLVNGRSSIPLFTKWFKTEVFENKAQVSEQMSYNYKKMYRGDIVLDDDGKLTYSYTYIKNVFEYLHNSTWTPNEINDISGLQDLCLTVEPSSLTNNLDENGNLMQDKSDIFNSVINQISTDAIRYLYNDELNDYDKLQQHLNIIPEYGMMGAHSDDTSGDDRDYTVIIYLNTESSTEYEGTLNFHIPTFEESEYTRTITQNKKYVELREVKVIPNYLNVVVMNHQINDNISAVIRHEVTKNLNSRNRYSVYTTYRKK
jgi:hypothetical protein